MSPALNGGPQFVFSPAISFFVNCKTQKEVDELWEKLSSGGESHQCGWLKDKYGVSWQVTPSALGEMLTDSDPAKSKRVMNAMLQMKKIDVAALKRAYEQRQGGWRSGQLKNRSTCRVRSFLFDYPVEGRPSGPQFRKAMSKETPPCDS
jgi:3-demethylubiquinone-9 3-methyltransferase